MNNFIDNITKRGYLFPRQKCFVSYTLGEKQPVACTIIGDQPLFYMDHEIDPDEEELWQSPEKDVFEDNFSLNSFLAGQTGFHNAKTDKSLQSTLNDFVGALGKVTGETKIRETYLSFDEVFSGSRTATAYLEFAREYGSAIEYNRQTEMVYYDRDSAVIYVNPTLERRLQILMVARELRRLWQHRHGALINPLSFYPDQAILVNRVQQADLTISMIRIAWELQLSNDKEAWQYLEHSSLADLAQAFANESFIDFRSLNNGRATSTVFERWFLSERCNHVDRQLIRMMLADYRGYVFDSAQSSKSITADLIAALGTQPIGKNYLVSHTHTIMSDPVFVDVKDRSNANFIWFIKFEQSFRDAERDLQAEKTINSPDNCLGNSVDSIESEAAQNEEAAEKIICLTQFKDKQKRTGTDKASSGRSEAE